MIKSKILLATLLTILVGSLASANSETVLEQKQYSVQVHPSHVFCQLKIGGHVSKDNIVPTWMELTLLGSGIVGDLSNSDRIESLASPEKLNTADCDAKRSEFVGVEQEEVIFSVEKVSVRSFQSNGLCIEDVVSRGGLTFNGIEFIGERHISRDSFSSSQSECEN